MDGTVCCRPAGTHACVADASHGLCLMLSPMTRCCVFETLVGAGVFAPPVLLVQALDLFDVLLMVAPSVLPPVLHVQHKPWS